MVLDIDYQISVKELDPEKAKIGIRLKEGTIHGFKKDPCPMYPPYVELNVAKEGTTPEYKYWLASKDTNGNWSFNRDWLDLQGSNQFQEWRANHGRQPFTGR